MKKILLGIAFLFGTLSLSAQNYEETIYLKDGSVISGIIIEQIPGKSMTIQTNDGNVIVYQVKDVAKITKNINNQPNNTSNRSSYNTPPNRSTNTNPPNRDSYNNTQNRNNYNSNNNGYNNNDYYNDRSYDNYSSEYGPQVGYKGFFDFGYSFGVGDYDADRIEFSTSHGYQVNPYFYAGIGAGVNYFTDAEVFSVPIFANPRLTLPTNSIVSPFLDLKIGYTVSEYVEGFYFSPSIGARIDARNNQAINFSFGYTLQKAKDYYYYDYYYNYSKTLTLGALTLKLGFEF